MSILKDLEISKETSARAIYCLERTEKMLHDAFAELTKFTNPEDSEVMEDMSHWLEILNTEDN